MDVAISERDPCVDVAISERDPCVDVAISERDPCCPDARPRVASTVPVRLRACAVTNANAFDW